jgi:hypothetical protein
MIARNLHRLKVEKGSLQTTSYAGLPLLTELAHQIGLIGKLDALPSLWQRQGAYSSSDYVMGLALTLIAGGEGLDDTRLLRSDPGLKQLALPELPAANSFGEFLRRFGQRSVFKLGEVVTNEAVRQLKPGQTVTLDIDSTLIESGKKEAKPTYKDFNGYNPVVAWLAEPGVFLGGVFRYGNASPQSHLVSLLRYCHRRVPANVKLRVRADSAAYRLDMIAYCQRHGMNFSISADLDCSVREVIEDIPEKAWQLVVRGNDTFLLAETVHAPGHRSRDEKLHSCRLIVTRRINAQLELFVDAIKYHAIISDFPPSWSTLQILDHHNGRGTAEKAIGELKHGYGLDKLPCGQLLANAAYFQIVLLAHNLVQTFKRFALPQSWRTFCIKNLRFRLLCQAAIVVRHARRLILKLPEAFPFFREFENARWAVMSPALAT